MSPSFHVFWLVITALLLARASYAQLPGEGVVSARSVSGQFVIQGRQVTSLPVSLLNSSTNRSFVLLEPTLLTVSAERVKQMIWREFGFAGAWKGKIHLELLPRRSPFDRIEILASRFADGWQYRLELPSLADRSQYLRSLVETILLELANRNSSSERLAEVPPWLVEGLAQHLSASGEMELIFPPPEMKQSDKPPTAFVMTKKENPLLGAHELLMRAGVGTTFEELCWRPSTFLGPGGEELYRSSAQVFYWHLTRLSDGRACLRKMLESLPQFYNWQLAFFSAFHGYFQRPLDVEKWWALQVVQFTGRDLGQAWLREQSLAKLEETLQVPVKVYDRTNGLPSRTFISLQEAVITLSLSEQIQILGGKLRQLELLHPRATPELGFLVTAYQSVIYDYLHGLPKSSKAQAQTTPPKGVSRSARILNEKLNTLDERLAEEKVSPSKTRDKATRGEQVSAQIN